MTRGEDGLAADPMDGDELLMLDGKDEEVEEVDEEAEEAIVC